MYVGQSKTGAHLQLSYTKAVSVEFWTLRDTVSLMLLLSAQHSLVANLGYRTGVLYVFSDGVSFDVERFNPLSFSRMTFG